MPETNLSVLCINLSHKHLLCANHGAILQGGRCTNETGPTLQQVSVVRCCCWCSVQPGWRFIRDAFWLSTLVSKLTEHTRGRPWGRLRVRIRSIEKTWSWKFSGRGQDKILSWYILLDWYKISGRRLEILVCQEHSSPGGSEGKRWADMPQIERD